MHASSVSFGQDAQLYGRASKLLDDANRTGPLLVFHINAAEHGDAGDHKNLGFGVAARRRMGFVGEAAEDSGAAQIDGPGFGDLDFDAAEDGVAFDADLVTFHAG